MVRPVLEPESGFLAAARPGRRIGHRVEVHASIGSTNDRARQLLADPDGAGVAVIAEEQRAGRGRRGRTWSSPAGLNLMMSLGLRPRLAATDAGRLGLAVALAARHACATVATVQMKWPNDIIAIDGRKVGGLLVETAVEGDALTEAVIGVGINVNWSVSEMPPALAVSATSLRELTGADVDRVALLARLLAALEEEIEGVEGGASPLPRYRAACSTLGSDVLVDLGHRVVEGRAADLDETGALVVATATGAVTIASGDVVRTRPAVTA